MALAIIVLATAINVLIVHCVPKKVVYQTHGNDFVNS